MTVKLIAERRVKGGKVEYVAGRLGKAQGMDLVFTENKDQAREWRTWDALADYLRKSSSDLTGISAVSLTEADPKAKVKYLEEQEQAKDPKDDGESAKKPTGNGSKKPKGGNSGKKPGRPPKKPKDGGEQAQAQADVAASAEPKKEEAKAK